MSYSTKTAKNGRQMYFRDGHLISKKNIPENAIIEDKDFDVEAVPTPPPPPVIDEEISTKNCLVCGLPASRMRYINSQIIRLCEDHYLTMTLGEVASFLK